MTIEDVGKIGERLLKEYEPRLKVHGVKPFDSSAKPAQKDSECYLPDASEDLIANQIRIVLGDLEKAGDFVMSDHRYSSVECMKTVNIGHNDLRLSFAYGVFIRDMKSYLWVSCHYFPFTRP